jgi:hypothetical protein
LGLLAAAAGGPQAALGRLLTSSAWGAGGALAFAGGYAVGKYVINPALDWTAEKLTGVKGQTLGGAAFDAMHEPYDINKKQINAPVRTSAPGRVHVTIDHKNPPPGTQVKVATQGPVTAAARVDRAMPSAALP